MLASGSRCRGTAKTCAGGGPAWGGKGASRTWAPTRQADGKIVVGGWSDVSGNGDFAILRYNADGSLDLTFGGDGKVSTDVGSAQDIAFDLIVQPDGRILLAGRSFNGLDYDFAVVRYN